MPPVLAGVHVQRHDGLREELLTGTPDVAVVRHRVPDADIDEAERRVDGERCPDGATTDVRALLRPRVGAELVAGRDQVELPLDLTGLGVEGEDLARCPEVTTGFADDQHPVDVGRRAREEVPLLPVPDHLLPRDAAGRLVETDDRAVRLRHVHLAVADDDSAARRQACREALRVLRLVVPEPLTRDGVERVDVALHIRHVHRAVVDDGLRLGEGAGEVRLALRRDGDPRVPRDLEVLDVGLGDRRQRRVLPVVDVTARGRPVVRWLRREIRRRERRDWFDRVFLRHRTPSNCRDDRADDEKNE